MKLHFNGQTHYLKASIAWEGDRGTVTLNLDHFEEKEVKKALNKEFPKIGFDNTFRQIDNDGQTQLIFDVVCNSEREQEINQFVEYQFVDEINQARNQLALDKLDEELSRFEAALKETNNQKEKEKIQLAAQEFIALHYEDIVESKYIKKIKKAYDRADTEKLEKEIKELNQFYKRMVPVSGFFAKTAHLFRHAEAIPSQLSNSFIIGAIVGVLIFLVPALLLSGILTPLVSALVLAAAMLLTGLVGVAWRFTQLYRRQNQQFSQKKVGREAFIEEMKKVKAGLENTEKRQPLQKEKSKKEETEKIFTRKKLLDDIKLYRPYANASGFLFGEKMEEQEGSNEEEGPGKGKEKEGSDERKKTV